MGYMRNSDSYVPHIFFSHKSVPSSTIPTFSPRARKLRNVKTEQRHLGEYNLRQSVFSLEILADAWNQRKVKNDE